MNPIGKKLAADCLYSLCFYYALESGIVYLYQIQFYQVSLGFYMFALAI